MGNSYWYCDKCNGNFDSGEKCDCNKIIKTPALMRIPMTLENGEHVVFEMPGIVYNDDSFPRDDSTKKSIFDKHAQWINTLRCIQLVPTNPKERS